MITDKDKNFRGRIKTYIWKKIVDQGIQSLGYGVAPYTLNYLTGYRNKEGIIVSLNSSFYVPNCSVSIGNKRDLEKIEKQGKLEQAMQYLEKLEELEGFRNHQRNFRKKIEGQEVQTCRKVLSRKLSRNPFLAIVEFGELHQRYKKFRDKYLEGKK